MLTPFPGTPLYARLRREGRLLQERFWDRCTLFDVTFRPKRMTVEELEAGLRWLFEETYTRRETEARLLRFVAQRRDARLAARRAGRAPTGAPAVPVPRPERREGRPEETRRRTSARPGPLKAETRVRIPLEPPQRFY